MPLHHVVGFIKSECEKYLRIFYEIMSVPQNIDMDLYNVMHKDKFVCRKRNEIRKKGSSFVVVSKSKDCSTDILPFDLVCSWEGLDSFKDFFHT